MKNVRLIGVPEHFNLPWHMAIEEGAFEDRGIDLQWTDVPEGTGRMCKMLREDEADMAIILTEGIIKDITAGNPSKIVQTYVQSPLLWGIHVAGDSSYKTIDDLKGSKAAISRYGSGSHLMAYVHAQSMGWDTSQLRFELINNLEGAVKALTNREADYFMWEHFTSKPLVDKGIFRNISDFPTPWPCFVIAARNDMIQENSGIIKHILEVINTYTTDFKSIPSIDRTLANRYEQQLEDIQHWLSKTRWSQRLIDRDTVQSIQNQLIALAIIDKKVPYNDLVAKLD
ncbi:substrate-binding domain-containing protein [Sungkyunkwania multivorans]|uniref:Substrate-binding domain-containing protein n=1 Tax=Sungkyunkwania multivorans TaxID=1173618 RepID=A0ABW3CZ59_9FLAO